MSAFSASPWIGARTIRPTDAVLEEVRKADPALYGVGLDNVLRHLHYFQVAVPGLTTAGQNAATGIIIPFKVPAKIVAMQVGVESAAGSAATADIEKKPSGGSWATMSTAAVDVKTGALTMQDLPVLDGAEDINAGDSVRMKTTGTGAGSIVGARAILHCFRR